MEVYNENRFVNMGSIINNNTGEEGLVTRREQNDGIHFGLGNRQAHMTCCDYMSYDSQKEEED